MVKELRVFPAEGAARAHLSSSCASCPRSEDVRLSSCAAAQTQAMGLCEEGESPPGEPQTPVGALRARNRDRGRAARRGHQLHAFRSLTFLFIDIRRVSYYDLFTSPRFEKFDVIVQILSYYIMYYDVDISTGA